MINRLRTIFSPKAASDGTDAGWVDIGDALGLPGFGRALALDDVLRLSAVSACLDVLAQDIGKTPLRLYRRTEDGGREIVAPKDHPLARLLNLKVNRFQTRAQFFSQLVYNLKLWGNGYIFIEEDIRGGAQALYCAPSAQVTVGQTQLGDIAYRLLLVSDLERALFGRQVFDAIERTVIHLRQRSFVGLMGVGALSTGAGYFSLAAKLADYRAHLYGSFGLANGVFHQDGDAPKLSDEAFERLDRMLSARYNAFRRGDEALLLEGGLKFSSHQNDADAAQVKDALERELTDACRLFRVPPHKIAALHSVKYDNIEPMERAYVSEALDPLMVDIELAFAARLLGEVEQDEYFFEFDRSRLQVIDLQTKIEKACQAYESGLWTANDAREFLGFNPWEQDMRLIRGNQAVVDSGGAVAYPGQSDSPSSE